MDEHEDARVALLSRLIDHAPLFPPASLPLPDAIAQDARARESPNAFMLARFVCPVSRLAELPNPGRGISAVLDRPLPSGANVEAGFLNLLAAVVFGDEESALAENDPQAFELDADVFSWRGRAAPARELVSARRDRLHSIGSCSFFEPVEELEALGVLPL